MTKSIECKKCNAVYIAKYFTHKKHKITCKCPFCGTEEKLEVGRDND